MQPAPPAGIIREARIDEADYRGRIRHDAQPQEKPRHFVIAQISKFQFPTPESRPLKARQVRISQATKDAYRLNQTPQRHCVHQ